MTFTAFEIHKDLVNEGFDPKSDDYYSEVNKRIKVDFPHKFAIGGDVEQTSKTNQLVASAQRSVRPGRTTVRLTSSQVAIAKKLGVPLEEYAKQIKLTEGA
jgi:phage I-like protein